MDCAPTVKPKDGVCSDERTLNIIKKNIHVDGSPKEVIEKAKTMTGCTTESCVVQRYADQDIVERLFLPRGPRESTDWLSNVNIDSALSQYEPFNYYHIPFQMRDFANSDNELSRADFPALSKKYKCAGCALNTDVSSGRGKHWVSFFVDFVNGTVEYFDSGGIPAPDEFVALVVKCARVLNYKDVFLTTVQHQRENTECGVYTLYYITSRIMGVPFSKFRGARISDEEMQHRRKLFFRA